MNACRKNVGPACQVFKLNYQFSILIMRRVYTRDGETFFTEGLIENYIATGGCIYHVCLLQLQFTFENITYFMHLLYFTLTLYALLYITLTL